MDDSEIDKFRACVKSEALALILEDTNWQPYSGSDIATGLVYRTYLDQYSNYAWKLKFVAKAPPEKLILQFQIDELVTKWMPNVAYQKTIIQKADWEIIHTRSHAPGIQDRDLLNVQFHGRLDTGGYYVLGMSLPDDTKFVFNNPFGNQCIRGVSHPCGIICEPIPDDPNTSKLTYMYNSDLKGSLPKLLINLTVSRFMLHFCKAAQSRAIEIAKLDETADQH